MYFKRKITIGKKLETQEFKS